MTLQGVITVLDDAHYNLVEGMARGLQEAFGVAEAKPTLRPHFSYHVAESYDGERVKERLRVLGQEMGVFRVQTTGLGIFMGGPAPVVYVNVVRDARLAQVHERVYGAVQGLARDANVHYEPMNWVPHITLGDKYLRPGTLPDIIRWLQDQNFVWDIEVNNLTFIGAGGFDEGEVVRLPLR